MPNPSLAALLAFAVSAILTLLLIETTHLHGVFSMDDQHKTQKMHTDPTPRIAGLSVYLAVSAAWLASEKPLSALLAPYLIAGLPAFLSGTIEDFTKKVSVAIRLGATLGSGLLAWWMTGYSLQREDVFLLGSLLSITAFAVMLTIIAIGGLSNALNLVDGFNGLALGIYIICMTALGTIAWRSGDALLVQTTAIFCLAAFGVMIFNFPYGKIFLGDGGAYFLGFSLGWTAILLIVRNPSVSLWAVLLTCSYPVIETLSSIWRRHKRQNHHPGQPDRVHLHHLIHARISKKLCKNRAAVIKNSMTSPFCWAISATFSALGVALFQHPKLAFVATLLAFSLYGIIYLRLSRFKWT